MISLAALFVGFVFGCLTTFLNLPLPAPNALAGVAGIVGLYLGFVFVQTVFKK